MSSFESLKLNKQLLQALQECGYTEPTAIQARAVPLVMSGHDVLGVSQTGTGKTAAYVLPMLMRLKCTPGSHPRALVLAPSKELVMQIAACVKDLAKYTELRVGCLYGGIGPKTQLEVLKNGVDIVIATPGRLLELHEREGVHLRMVKFFVLDEADRMFDMGFWPQIKSILELLPGKRQNLLFSATMPASVLTLADDFLEFPQKAVVTPQATPAKTVSQNLYYVPNLSTKVSLLVHLLADEVDLHRVIVFVKTKQTAADIAKCLQRKSTGGVRVLHSNKCQNTRINALREFMDGEVRILVATNVAARGLDVHKVSHVINFDVPLAYEEYVHRIGRTGRAQHSGCAITFANEAEKYHINKIEKLICQHIPVLPMPAEVEIAPTSFEEQQAMAKSLDFQRQKDDPNYNGAFHKRKKKIVSSFKFKPRK